MNEMTQKAQGVGRRTFFRDVKAHVPLVNWKLGFLFSYLFKSKMNLLHANGLPRFYED